MPPLFVVDHVDLTRQILPEASLANSGGIVLCTVLMRWNRSSRSYGDQDEPNSVHMLALGKP